jgi:hypothetical protein
MLSLFSRPLWLHMATEQEKAMTRNLGPGCVQLATKEDL